MEMKRLLFALIAFFAGASLLIFRKRLAVDQKRSQKEVWGISLTEQDQKGSEFAAVIVGILFILIGALLLFGIGRMK
jgi:hypothetical protein